ncbi:MAG: hypothetical protein ABS80_01925 [Pseudonocardia sp. SCN 72-51]|nr:MAG: hypothetical protein ABS80_01925 [Pseudonocardia sp. SCN 72-51]
MPHLLRFAWLALAMGVDTLTGVALMLTRSVLAPGYSTAHPGWGPTGLVDQNIAGAVMWWGGDALMMLLLVVVALQWGRASAAGQGLGNFLEGVRRVTVLGPGASEVSEIDGDDDESALAAYNARLAALFTQGSQHGSPQAWREGER